jgi:hypothetical protein
MIATIAFIVGFVTAALIFRAPAFAPMLAGPPLPAVGSRWSLRGHVGEVFAIHKGKGMICFVHDDGDDQVVPIEYFMALARPITSEAP